MTTPPPAMLMVATLPAVDVLVPVPLDVHETCEGEARGIRALGDRAGPSRHVRAGLGVAGAVAGRVADLIRENAAGVVSSGAGKLPAGKRGGEPERLVSPRGFVCLMMLTVPQFVRSTSPGPTRSFICGRAPSCRTMRLTAVRPCRTPLHEFSAGNTPASVRLIPASPNSLSLQGLRRRRRDRRPSRPAGADVHPRLGEPDRRSGSSATDPSTAALLLPTSQASRW